MSSSLVDGEDDDGRGFVLCMACSAWYSSAGGQMWSNPWKIGMSLLAGLGGSAGESQGEFGCPDLLELSWTAGLEPKAGATQPVST